MSTYRSGELHAEETTAPRRLRAQDVIDTLENALSAALTRSATEPSVSIQLSRNAKGETQIETKLHAPVSAIREDLEVMMQDALAVAQASYDQTCAKYPTGSGFVRNDGDAGK